MANPMMKLSKVQKSIMEVTFKYLRGEIDEEEFSDEVDATVQEHQYLNSIQEDMDYYYRSVAAG